MMKSRLYYIFTVAFVMMLICVSCRPDLCYDHYPQVDVKFSWEQEWERDYGMNHYATWDPVWHNYEYDALRPGVPEWVKMVKYYDDGRMVEKLFTPEGQKFEVPSDDKCSMLFYNGDTEYIILSDVASLQDVRATATSRSRSGSSLQDMQNIYKDSRTTNSPDVIYSSYMPESFGASVHEVKPMPVNMQPLVYTYLITYEFDEGIEYVEAARGALGGMAEGVYLRTGTTTDESCIILFDCDINSDACRCLVRSFGVPGFSDSNFGRQEKAGSSGPFSLMLELKLMDGTTKEFNFDITDQITKQPRGGVIRVSGISVESGGSTVSGGFDVGVSDWEDDVFEDLPVEPN